MQATIVDVGPRDGFQPIGPFIPTATKIDVMRGLYAAGLRRIEVTAFVSDAAVPQMADAAAVLAEARPLAGLDAQVLVPNARHAARALAAGADHIAFVVSVSERHNRNNVRRTPLESVEEYAGICGGLPQGTRVRLNMATAFDCPFDGAVDPDDVMTLLDRLVPIQPDAEIALCDTTGRVTPDRVEALFARVRAAFPGLPLAFHGHDTYGLGVANVLAAWSTGVEVFDASIGGLGGCPFAPGATGNVSTEDVAWTLDRMGIATGLDLDRLLLVAGAVTALPGAAPGGRVRDALAASARCCGDKADG